MTVDGRKILHVDMDAFYASVEQRDRPELRGRPVVVGGDPFGRGVVATASYEARAFGVRSAIPSAQARRLCPHAVFLAPDFKRYKEVSAQVQAIFREVTELVEPLSLDEAYLDVTRNQLGQPSATRVAEWVLARIRHDTGLSASAGVAPNKFLAKVASDVHKPGGLTVVPPERAASFAAALPLRRVPGIGPVTEARCGRLGLHTCADVLGHDDATLSAWFGAWGPELRQLAQGIDPRPVVAERARKSVSAEDTFPEDLHHRREALAHLDELAARLEQRLVRAGERGRTLTLKVKYSDFTQITRSRTYPLFLGTREQLLDGVTDLLGQTEVGRRPVRLLGIGVSQLEGDEPQRYLPFFAAPRAESP